MFFYFRKLVELHTFKNVQFTVKNVQFTVKNVQFTVPKWSEKVQKAVKSV